MSHTLVVNYKQEYTSGEMVSVAGELFEDLKRQLRELDTRGYTPKNGLVITVRTKGVSDEERG